MGFQALEAHSRQIKVLNWKKWRKNDNNTTLIFQLMISITTYKILGFILLFS